MPELHYRDAQKLGQREYRACVAAGRYPYLPVLDEILPQENAAMGQNLGIMSVPMAFIVGTRTRGRTNAFAGNFMPLLAENSEFAQKWERLCQSHLEEGIRDPIKVCEYLNRYYVEEGNKRVSVLKFFGAVSVPAQVTRILPTDRSTPEAEQYMEYLAFHRASGINYLELSKRGGYARLLALVGKQPDEPWSDEDRSRFSTAYYGFQRAYAAVAGGKPVASVGDAMLAYLEIHGYAALCEAGAGDLKKSVSKMWEELQLQREETAIELKPAPAAQKKEGLLSRVLPSGRATRAAFIYDRNPSDSAWAHGHEQGRLHVQQVFDGRIETAAYCNAMEGDPLSVLERAIADGSRVIFTTSPRLLPASLKAAVEHPEVTIFNCALNQPHRYIRTYYARVYEAKYIVGALAGAMAGEGDIGYICDYPIYGVIAGINAFALGVQLTNPRARVRLEWSSVDGHRAARKKLSEEGLRLISCQDFSRQPDGSFGLNGLMRIEGGEAAMLAAPVWRWDVYYEEMLGRILDKTAKDEYESSAKALNYYWGMSAGVVDVRCAPDLPEGLQKLSHLLREGICGDRISPFATPVRNQEGAPVDADGDRLELEQIVKMDWLVQNVVGAIPVQQELTRGRQTVEIMGVDPSAKDKTQVE